MNNPTNGVAPCGPAAVTRPRGDIVPATVIILVVVLSAVWLAMDGMTVKFIASLFATATATAGYLVRQLRGQVTQ